MHERFTPCLSLTLSVCPASASHTLSHLHFPSTFPPTTHPQACSSRPNGSVGAPAPKPAALRQLVPAALRLGDSSRRKLRGTAAAAAAAWGRGWRWWGVGARGFGGQWEAGSKHAAVGGNGRLQVIDDTTRRRCCLVLVLLQMRGLCVAGRVAGWLGGWLFGIFESVCVLAAVY